MTTVTSEKMALADWLGKVAEIARRKLQSGDALITFPLSAEMVERFEQAETLIRERRKSVLEAFAVGSGSADLRDAFDALENCRKNEGKPMSTAQMLSVLDLLEKYGRTPEEWVRLMRGGNEAFERELNELLEGIS